MKPPHLVPAVERLVRSMPKRDVTLLRVPDPTMPLLQPRTVQIFTEELSRVERTMYDVEVLQTTLRELKRRKMVA